MVNLFASRIGLSTMVLLAGLAAWADDPYASRPLLGTRCTQPPTLDGDLSDECWKASPKAETWVDLFDNTPMKDQTIGYVLYDDKYIYVGVDCRDEQPDQILARETVRDSKFQGGGGDNNNEDGVSFGIDPYNTKKPNDVSEFFVNALGTPSAALSGGRGGKLEWKGKWDSAAKRTATGYTVEMRIPWEMLNYPKGSKPMTMGINFWRYHNRTKRLSMWSNVTQANLWDKNGQWSGITPPQIAYKPQVSILPYILPGATEDKTTFRSGVDARVALTPELTYVGSLNPDFGTIEGAVESIAYSRKERFVPDRRPFFQDGGDNFFPQTNINDVGAYFYPRRIRTFDLGTKLYGKINPTDTIGFQNTVTFGKRSDTILRMKHDLSDTADVGFFMGNTVGETLESNSVLLADQHARFGNYNVETQFAMTKGRGADGGAVVLSNYYQKDGFLAWAQYHSISDRFNITSGFIPYKDYHGPMGGVNLSSSPQKGPFARTSFGLFGMLWDHNDGSRYQRATNVSASVLTRKDMRIGLNHSYAIVDGTIDSTTTLTAVQGATNRFLQYGASLQAGRYGGQKGTYIAPLGSARLFKKLDVGYSGSILNLNGVNQQHTVTMGYELSPTRSFGGRVVMSGRDTNWYLSYRNSGNKGTDFYVILGDPNARKFTKQLQMKWVFAL